MHAWHALSVCASSGSANASALAPEMQAFWGALSGHTVGKVVDVPTCRHVTYRDRHYDAVSELIIYNINTGIPVILDNIIFQ